MKVQTFLAKMSVESIRQMDEHINDWLVKHNVEPKWVNQTFGYERIHHHSEAEPVLVTSIWYSAR